MTTFFQTTTYTPLSSASSVIVEEVVAPIIPAIIPSYTYQATKPLYYPSIDPYVSYAYATRPIKPSVGETPYARDQINMYIRSKFLDKWIYDNYPELFAYLRIENEKCVVISRESARKNDISKDTQKELKQKIEFIRNNILTISKSNKILTAFSKKNNVPFFEIPHQKEYIKKAIAKYVKLKLKQFRK